MRILWIPHQQLANTNRARCEYLASHMKDDEHRILHWRKWKWSWHDMRTILSGVETESNSQRFVFVRLLVINRLFWWFISKLTNSRYAIAKHWLGYVPYNNFLLNRAIRKIVTAWQPDVLIFSNNAIGRVDVRRFQNLVTIFDYVDLPYMQHPVIDEIITNYSRDADATTCVSKTLVADLEPGNPGKIHYLPNGLDRERLNKPVKPRKEKRCVVSLIGLTCSDRLYFVDAIKVLIDEGLPIVGLMVGAGLMLEPIKQRIQGYESSFILTGQVSFDEVQDYFDMTDIGLYPVEDSPYYLAASPIKCFEYSFKGSHVLVSPHLPEVDGYNLPNMSFCEENQDAVTEALRKLIDQPRMSVDESDFDAFDWSERAHTLNAIIERLHTP